MKTHTSFWYFFLAQAKHLVVIATVLSLLMSGMSLPMVSAQESVPLEDAREIEGSISASETTQVGIQEASFGYAWGDPDGLHSVYDWPYTFDQMGLVIQSYQNYSSGTSSAYFHHGIDMVVVNNNTQVFNRSGGQVINIENYQPGNSLYWEVAILDPEGYVWQYHHIDQPTIPQLIKSKYAEWQADPVNGGFIPPNTHIGNIVYWPVVSLGYRFNHIHLNILGAGDTYLNTLEFHTPIVDTQIPEIQEIGLLNGDTVISGNTATGNYGMYVRARDLYQSPVYYLPPYKTEFSLDGGDWVTVWEFHDLPGGSNDEAFVNDFFVPGYTKGNYDARDFYIDLGFTTSGQRQFPSETGEHNITVRVWDYYGNSDTETFTWNVLNYKTYENATSSNIPDNGCTSGNGITRTFNVTENMEITDINLGVNLSHSRRGQIRVTLKSPTNSTATTIINTASDSYDNYDLLLDDASSNAVNDRSNDSVSSPYYDRIAGPSTNGSLDAFNGQSSLGTWTVFVCDNTSSTTGTVNRIKLELAGIDNSNSAPVADALQVATAEDTALGIVLTGSDAEGDPLSFTVTAEPQHGTLVGTAPDLEYQPEADFNGTDAFSFVVNDGQEDSQTALVEITVTPVNDAPLANAQTLAVAEDASLVLVLTGSDVDGDALTYEVAGAPAHGSLQGTAPNLTYVPIENYNGPDSLTFSVSDGTLGSDLAVISITVTAVNDAPVADAQQVSTDEDQALSVTLTGSDVDGDALTYSVSTAPAHGVLTGTAPDLTYTPDADFNGPDSFAYVASDGSASSLPALVTLAVAAVNDAPVAEGQSLTTQQDLPLEISLTAVDVDGDELAYAIETPPVYGVLGGTAPQLTYTPAAGFTGEDSFSFTASDGVLFSSPAEILISVVRTNTAPVADALQVTTAEDTALGIVLTGSDAEGDPLSFTVTAEPQHGTLFGTAPDLEYQPEADFIGTDAFSFVVNDGQVDSQTALVEITVTPVNDAPLANAQTLAVAEDASLVLVLTGSDVDGDALTYEVAGAPAHGSLQGTAPNLTYVPIENYNGPDSLTFSVSDGTLGSDLAVISITVTAVNDAPVADAQQVSTDEDQALSVTLTGSDVDGDALTYSVSTAPAHGVLTGTAPDLTYTPDADFNGPDSFAYVASDGSASSLPALVTLAVAAVNDAPVAEGQSLTTQQDLPLEISLTAVDVDGDELAYAIETPPVYGVLGGTAPQLTYTPAAGFTGEDSFSFTASDGVTSSELALVGITVTSAGPVTIFEDDFESDRGWSINPYDLDTATTGMWERTNPETVDYNGYKQLGDTVSGSFDLVTGGLAGSDAGSYDIDNGKTSILSPIITLPVNRELSLKFFYYFAHASNASADDYLRVSVLGNETVLVFEELGAGNDDDALWEEASVNISSFAGQQVRLLIEAADAGTASLVEAGIDDVLILSERPNTPPIAFDQSGSLQEDSALALTLLGEDLDGDALTFRIGSSPLNGILTGTAPDLTYTPFENFNGQDGFTYLVNDGKVDSQPGTVILSIAAVNDQPLAIAQNISTTVGTPLAIELTGSDVDGDPLTYRVTAQPVNGQLAGSAPSLVYTPNAAFVGTDSFTFIVNDGLVDSDEVVVGILVNPAGPLTVFSDDFESDLGWIRNPYGSDTATLGWLERANPETVSYYGYKQLGTTASGSYDLVTGPLAGSSAGSYDLDGGVTTMRSPEITLPAGRTLTLSFTYYFAHYTNSSTADYLRVKVIGNTTSTVFQELGANNDDDAVWATASVNLDSFAGQTIYLLIEVADVSTASLVEAAVDDIVIIAE